MSVMFVPYRQAREVSRIVFIDYRPQLESILQRYEIPASDAANLLEELAMELIYKMIDVEDLAGWLRARMRNQCRRYWLARRRLVKAAVDRFFAPPS